MLKLVTLTTYNNRPSAVTNLKRRNTTIATTVAISYTSPSRKGKNTDCQPYTDSDIDYLLQYTRANPLNPNQPITLSETSEGNQIFLRDLVSNTKYTVRVIANNPNGRGLNADGSEAWSEPIEFTTNVDCPGPVTSAKAVKNEDHETLADNTVTLSWVAPLYTGNSRIRNYQIKQVGTEGGVNASYIALSTSRTTPVLRPGKYKFSIKPVNAAATPGCLNEVETNEIQVFGPPTTPRNSSIKVNDTGDGFLFGWSPPRSNGGRVVTKYNISIVSEDIFDDKVARIFGFTTGVSTTDQDHEFEFNTTSYRIGTTPLRFKRGQSVRMAVQAVNPEGTSGYSTSITGTIPFERPSVVTGMVTSWDTIRLQLIALFEASSDDGGKPITSYESQLRRNGITVATESITGTDLTQPVIGTGFEGALLEAGVYQIRVRPVNEVGPGRWVTKNVERPLTAPSIPQSLRVESFDQSSIFYSSRYIFQGPINWGGTPISQRQIQIDFRDQNEIRNIDQNIGTSSPYESAFRGTTPLRAFRDHRIRAVNSIVETGKFDSTPISASAWLEWADNDGPAITP